jgi:hypothetical protein
MTQYEGRCVDLLRAFHGASGTENAYEKGLMNHDNCCYPSAEGQQLIAELVVRTGLRHLNRRATRMHRGERRRGPLSAERPLQR